MPSSFAHDRLDRLGRLTLKELREILRDRRTIITLVLMPLLMYPLLSVAFQQFFLSQMANVETPRYTVGFPSDGDANYFVHVLTAGGLIFASLMFSHINMGEITIRALEQSSFGQRLTPEQKQQIAASSNGTGPRVRGMIFAALGTTLTIAANSEMYQRRRVALRKSRSFRKEAARSRNADSFSRVKYATFNRRKRREN